VLAALGHPEARQSLEVVPSGALLPLLDRDDAAAKLRELLIEMVGATSCCVVLDNGHIEGCGPDLSHIRSVLLEATSLESCVVVTSRQEGDLAVAPWDADVWFVDGLDLQMNRSEAVGLSEILSAPDTSEHQISAALKLSHGQAALLSLLLQYPRAIEWVATTGPDSALPKRLARCIQQLTTVNVSMDDVRLVYAAGLLGWGSEESLVRVAGAQAGVGLVSRLTQAVPLLTSSQDESGALVFRAHDLLFTALTDPSFRQSLDLDSVADASVRELFQQRRYDQMFAVLEAIGDVEALSHWAERAGYDLVLSASFVLLRRILSQIPLETRLQRPRLMLVSGAMLRQTHKLDEALGEVQAACRLVAALSSTVDPDSTLLLARLQADLSRFDAVAETLKPLLDGQSPGLDDESRCLAHGLMALSCAHLGLSRLAAENAREVERLLSSRSLPPEVQAHALNCCSFVYAYALSDTAAASRLLSKICSLTGVPLVWRLQAQGNLATLLYESGRLHASIKLLQSTLADCKEHRLTLLRLEYLGSLAAALAGRGDYDEAEVVALEAIEGARSHADEFSAMANQMMRIAWRRACGNVDDALEDAEAASSAFGRLESPSMQWLATLEVAACRLALRERSAAYEIANSVRQAAVELGSAYHLLRADMILAEIERERGEYSAAVDRITAQAEYIATESSNWQIAMYLRAFPGLLGVFAQAVGAEKLPGHMLRMILPEPAQLGLDMARTILDPESFKTLAVRTLGIEEAEQYLAGDGRLVRLRVGLFGGLNVVTPHGAIQDGDWRKRKSRLLFAMLVARRGEDIPKDVLFERLWPEMDEDRAKSNFYVIWSAMKRVLCNGPHADDCVYVEHRAGVCRAVADRILCDLDEFDAAEADLRTAERARNIQDAIEAGERLCMIYHGDVLPGDLYDDWFGPLRERYRDAFGDAMLQAAELAADGGQTEASLRFIRAGLAQDLWREDLYQAALRYQISSGQRSSAIETYLACRTKLADDLGLDPSVETQRLYEQVLAMETTPAKSVRY